ncbi:MAG TPA: RNA methyltransferase, partial [Vicinamibacterales bacterium]|nr:RNA methyltransferase [Vicinamibacterales bacterium]
GSTIRSADALGATGVAALGATADPSGWKVLRGSMGSAFRLPVARGTLAAALAAARQAGVCVLATTSAGGVPVADADLTPPSLVLLGHEGTGLPADLVAAADGVVSIPMRAGVDSLNVAVAAALVLDEARRQRARGPRS